jgi:uncharacterized protein YegP (UPF0339 family)
MASLAIPWGEALRRAACVAPARFQLFRLGGDWVEWRFIASNNRVIANGGDGMEDGHAARAMLADLQSEIPGASSACYQDTAGRWRWDVRNLDTVLAASSRWYHRRVDCESTLLHFLHDAPGAPVVDGIKAFRSVIDLPAGRVVLPAATPRAVSARSRSGGLGASSH